MSKKFIFGGSYSGNVCPIEATTYLDNQGITDPTIRGNVCTMVSSLISEGVYNLIDVLYPDAGNSASTNNLNLVNPIDSDSAYRRTFGGGVTFDPINGTRGNGTNGYYDTKYNPNSVMSLATGAGVYLSLKTTNTGGIDLESFDGNGLYLQARTGASYFSCLGNNYSFANQPTAIGSYILNREPSNSTQFYQNLRGTSSTVNIAFGNPNAKVFGMSRFGSVAFSDKAQIGLVLYKGATNAQAEIIKTIMDNFNTNMGR